MNSDATEDENQKCEHASLGTHGAAGQPLCAMERRIHQVALRQKTAIGS